MHNRLGNCAHTVVNVYCRGRYQVSSLVSPTLFNIFINDLEDGIKCIIIKWVKDTKVHWRMN